MTRMSARPAARVGPMPVSEWQARWRGVRFTRPGEGERPIRLLVFTSLYPNAVHPRHGVFVEERLRKLVASGRVTATVVAPVPWFPLRHRYFGAWAAFARVPLLERRHGIDIHHPRHALIPKLGMRMTPALMVRALAPVLRKLAAGGVGFDLIDAHYLYPDGVAAARLGAMLGQPVVITARGCDVTLLPRYRAARGQILRAAEQAATVVTVSQHLQDKLVALGVEPAKTTVLRNGVDLERFRPLERDAIRARLGVDGPVWLSVGHLIERKGVRFAIGALAQVADASLLIAGDGPRESDLRALVHSLGLDTRVRFLGAIAHDELCRYYNAADVLVHPASREGMPNVVLESLACGTPVVAAPFDGVAELLDAPEAGEIAAERSADALVRAWLRLQARAPARAATRRHGERFDWAPVVAAQVALYTQVAQRSITSRRAEPEATP